MPRLAADKRYSLDTMEILALSGSLREGSINSALCRAASRLAPPAMRVTVFSGLGSLPLFNPDLEAVPLPAVQAFRLAVGKANALLIASPEYAHGISGAMKNALDWLVSFEGTVGKPVALINTSPRAHHAYEALREVLQTMSTSIIGEASPAIPLLGACTTEEAMIHSPEVSRAIGAALEALAVHLAGSGASGPSFPLT
jgi:chromate reductase